MSQEFCVLAIAVLHGFANLFQSRMLIPHGGGGIRVTQRFHERCEIPGAGPGGWACVLRYRSRGRELVGYEPTTTNNRMELLAVIDGLRALREPCNVIIRTDSQYVKHGMTSWIATWKAHGWVHRVKGQGKQPVKNRELWEEIDRLTHLHHVEWEWVRGHADNEDNIRCHELANRAARGCASELRISRGFTAWVQPFRV